MGHFARQVGYFYVQSLSLYILMGLVRASSECMQPILISYSQSFKFAKIPGSCKRKCADGDITIGTITVAVSAGAAGTSTTELPCSSYLTAQSSYLNSFENPGEPGAIFDRWPPAWDSGFGRSPECLSYAQAYLSKGQWTLSGCPASDVPVPVTAALNGFHPPQLPAAIFRQHIDQIYECCGNCSVNVPQVRLYYFPDSTEKQYCQGLNQTVSSPNATITGNGPAPSIAITNGHTL